MESIIGGTGQMYTFGSHYLIFSMSRCAYAFFMIADRTSLPCRNFFFALLACLPAIAWGNAPQLLPQDLAMRVWSKQQGLPDDSVTSVLQTRDGYLWIGTAGGLEIGRA